MLTSSVSFGDETLTAAVNDNVSDDEEEDDNADGLIVVLALF